jgi:GNAT superfamily N-acetyltransferase
VRVRQARAGDAGQIAVVHVRSWQAAYRGLVPHDYLDDLDPDLRQASWEAALAQDAWPRAGVLVAAAGEEIAGFAALGPARDDDEDPALTGEIRAIYLLPQAWGRGAGRQLMTTALDVLARARYEQATLWVLDSNDRARRFYEAAGWQPDGAVKTDAARGFPLAEVRYRHALPAPALPRPALPRPALP